MKRVKILTILLTCLLVLSFGSSAVQAKQKGYVTTPIALRGRWYRYDKHAHRYQMMRFTKYTAHFESGKTFSGKKKVSNRTPKYQMFVSKQGSYYQIGRTYTDDYVFVKRTMHTIHGKRRTALTFKTFPMGPGSSIHRYWYQTHIK